MWDSLQKVLMRNCHIPREELAFVRQIVEGVRGADHQMDHVVLYKMSQYLLHI